MVEVQRANVFLTISEDEIDKYMAKGFSVVDPKTGKVIKQSVPTEIAPLQKAYSEHMTMIKALQSENALLKKRLKALETAGVEKTPAGKSSPKGEAEENPEWGDGWEDAEEVEEEKPKKSKKR